MRGKKVFISYTHTTEEFADKVLDFANYLRKKNIDVILDQYEEFHPNEGAAWVKSKSEEADYVIAVCTPEYYERVMSFNKETSEYWEIEGMYDLIKDSQKNIKIIPVMFNNYKTTNFIKEVLSSTIYQVEREKDFNKLLNKISKDTIGEALEEKSRKTLFITDQTDNKLWDKSGFEAIMYLYNKEKGKPPIICLLFKEKSYGERIFKSWKSKSNENPFDEISVSLVYKDNDKEQHGYYFVINSNYENRVENASEKGYNLVCRNTMDIPRHQYMGINMYDNNYAKFKETFEELKTFYIAPAYFKGGIVTANVNSTEVGAELAILMDKVSFKNYEDITSDDIEGCILEEIK